MDENKFYTLKGYTRKDPPNITPSMEDYLEMICRYHQNNAGVRISFLANKLHVRPSSASKMVANLRDAGLVSFEHYGIVYPTALGQEKGQALLERHALLHEFFCLLNHSDNQLEQVEKIEHFILPETLEHLRLLVDKMKKHEPF